MSVLPDYELEYLNIKGLPFQELTQGSQNAIILKDFVLPQGKYDHPSADVLVLLPAGFPDASPDMFYVFPWLKLISGNSYPRAADVPYSFAGRSWQRWSRHSNEWRPGRDGLATFVARIRHAIETASA